MIVRVQVPPRVPFARIAQLVEHDLAKVGVAGSSPVSRSLKGFTFCEAFFVPNILHLVGCPVFRFTDFHYFISCSLKIKKGHLF